MLLTRARVVPHSARARFVSLPGVIVTAPFSTLAATSPLTVVVSAPRRPLTVSVCPESWTSTPCGIATGCLPIRDMITSNSGASEHSAQHLAADIGGAGFVVGQDTARSGQDRDAEPARDARQVHELRINAAAGLRDARNLANDRLAIDVFQFDLELGDAGADLLAGKAADVSFPLQDIQNVGAHLRGRRGDNRLPSALSVADAGQHVAERIAHCHGSPPLTSSTSACPGSGPMTPIPAPRCVTT